MQGKRADRRSSVKWWADQGKKLPDQPPDCRRKEKSGIVLGDRLDEVLADVDRRKVYDETRRSSLIDDPLAVAREIWSNHLGKMQQ